MTTKVALLCPVAETINPKVFQHTMAAVSYASAHGYTIDFVGVTERQLVHQARNVLARGFKETDCEWAFWMDSDMVFPPSTIVRLIEKAKEVGTQFMTGVYYQRLGDHLPVLWRKQPELTDGRKVGFADLPPDAKEAYLHHFIIPNGMDPIKADVCGFGCLVMHRDLVEKIEYPYFKMISDNCSEDFYFCIKARDAGFQLWADPGFEILHMGMPAWYGPKDIKLDVSKLVEVKK